ncbi:A-kinase anchor protein 5 [Sigmodon hispidus]
MKECSVKMESGVSEIQVETKDEKGSVAVSPQEEGQERKTTTLCFKRRKKENKRKPKVGSKTAEVTKKHPPEAEAPDQPQPTGAWASIKRLVTYRKRSESSKKQKAFEAEGKPETVDPSKKKAKSRLRIPCIRFSRGTKRSHRSKLTEDSDYNIHVDDLEMKTQTQSADQTNQAKPTQGLQEGVLVKDSKEVQESQVSNSVTCRENVISVELELENESSAVQLGTPALEKEAKVITVKQSERVKQESPLESSEADSSHPAASDAPATAYQRSMEEPSERAPSKEDGRGTERDAVEKKSGEIALGQAEETTSSQAEKVPVSQANTNAVARAHEATVVRADTTAVVRADTTAVVREDKAPVARADTSAVVQADKATVAQADTSAVAREDKVPVAQADTSAVVQVHEATVAREDKVPVARADTTAVVQVHEATVAREDKAPVARADTTAVVQVHEATVAQADTSAVAREDKVPVARADTSTVARAGTTAVAREDKAPVVRTDTSAVVQADEATVTREDEAAVAQADTSAVAQADTSAVAQADTSAVAQADTSAVVQADTTAVAQADTTAVAQADEAPVAQADKAALRQAVEDAVNQVPDLKENGTDIEKPRLEESKKMEPIAIIITDTEISEFDVKKSKNVPKQFLISMENEQVGGFANDSDFEGRTSEQYETLLIETASSLVKNAIQLSVEQLVNEMVSEDNKINTLLQ